MARYISLINWTEQGVKNFRGSSDRADAAAKLFESLGGAMVDTYWTLGPYDLVVISDFPDDETVTAAMLRVCELGNIRTTTMRAFDRATVQGIVEKAG